MVEKIGTIRNPLTIIAIFAAIAEISGTMVLPFISDGNQGTYIWFLMIFPLLLVVLFFITLNFNHKVLYAPSDFKNEDNFFKSFQAASPAERAEKLREEVREIESEPVAEPAQVVPAPQSEQERRALLMKVQRDIRARYLLAENLVLNKISKELGQPVKRDMRFETPGRRFVFDGVVMTDDKVTAIEVKYFRDSRIISNRFKDVFHGILDAAERLPDSMRNRFSLILAIATDAPTSDHDQLTRRLSALIGITPFPVEIRVFSLDELEQEFNLAG